MSTSSANTIPFTQYLLPNGHTKDVSIERSPEVVEVAHRLIESGCRFEIEMLMTGQVSMTCERDDDDGEVETLAIKICANGPGVVGETVDKLVTAAAREASR